MKDGLHAPELTERETRQVGARAAIGPQVIHEAIREEGEEELERPSASLAWSGLAAGLSMGFSLVAEGLLRGHLPDAAWRPLIAKWGYSVGFLIVILGRQQLFTENTLTPIIPLLARRDMRTLLQVARLWAIVLATNLVGAAIFAWIIGNTQIFSPEIKQTFSAIGQEAIKADWGTTFLRAVFSGWLIALMVWLLPGTQSSRLLVILIITFLVGLGGLNHIVAGSAEALYLVATGVASLGYCLGSYMLPTLLGNIVGGVLLVAVVNHAQVIAGKNRNGMAPNEREPARADGDGRA